MSFVVGHPVMYINAKFCYHLRNRVKNIFYIFVLQTVIIIKAFGKLEQSALKFCISILALWDLAKQCPPFNFETLCILFGLEKVGAC